MYKEESENFPLDSTEQAKVFEELLEIIEKEVLDDLVKEVRYETLEELLGIDFKVSSVKNFFLDKIDYFTAKIRESQQAIAVLNKETDNYEESNNSNGSLNKNSNLLEEKVFFEQQIQSIESLIFSQMNKYDSECESLLLVQGTIDFLKDPKTRKVSPAEDKDYQESINDWVQKKAFLVKIIDDTIENIEQLSRLKLAIQDFLDPDEYIRLGSQAIRSVGKNIMFFNSTINHINNIRSLPIKLKNDIHLSYRMNQLLELSNQLNSSETKLISIAKSYR